MKENSEIRQWKEESRNEVFSKYARRIDEVGFLLPNGKHADFYIKNEGKSCSILGLTDNNEVILVKQFRPGPKMIMDELPGGFVDKDEEPETAALREFNEETGYTGDIEFVGTCYDDAYSTMLRYCYIARNSRKIGNPQNANSEWTEVVLYDVDSFRKHLQSGKMTDVEVGYLCLDYLKLL